MDSTDKNRLGIVGASSMQLSDSASEPVRVGLPFLERHGCRALVFDWDGVLVDSGPNYYRAYEMVLQDTGVTTTPREIYLREGQPTPQVLAAILSDRGITVDEDRLSELMERRREYDIALGKHKFFNGIWALVKRLRHAGYRTGMVTGSSRKSVEGVLTRDLEAAFDVVITADDVERGKPDPQSFVMAAATLGLSAAQCLVIENAPFGIQAARAAGCSVVGICTTLSSEDLTGADWIVRNHDELIALLAGKAVKSNAQAEEPTEW
jgi:beta-phosphoglucomutase